MTTDSQQATLLNLLGWQRVLDIGWVPPGEIPCMGASYAAPPLMLLDLNAQHYLFKKLAKERGTIFAFNYANYLYAALGNHDHVEVEAINAGPETRAEALLRAAGKWDT